MSNTRKVEISEELFDLIQSELMDLRGYHWNDDNFHADDCGSKSLMEFEYAWDEAEVLR